MIVPLLIALGIIALTIVIQVITINILLRFLASHKRDDEASANLQGEVWTLSFSLIIVMLGHVAQMAIWAVVFQMIGQFEDFATAFYHSAVNFTSLGYGDLVMEEPWRVLGPLEAGNGILMFGLSTAFYFAVLSRIYTRLSKAREKTS